MHIDLFNQALLLCMSFLAFISLAYGFLKNTTIHPAHVPHKRIKSKQRPWKHTVAITVGSIILGIIIRAIIQAQFPEDTIPWESVIWSIPLGMAVILAGYNFRARWGAIANVGGVVSSALLLLLLANNYYHYYPTLDAVFNNTQVEVQIVPVPTKDISSKTVLESYYQAIPGQPTTGDLQGLDIPASGAFSPRQGRIYLPPALHGNNTIRLPVIVLLAGYPGKPTDWEQAGLLSIMNDFAQKHKGLAPIVAVVDFEGQKGTDTECVDSKLGDSETYLTKDVPSYLKTHYQVSHATSDWTIAGYSAGGTCSTLVALRNPSVYQNYMNISGDTCPSLNTQAETLRTLFSGSRSDQDAHTPSLLLEKGNPLYKTMNGWYFIGQQDNPAVISRTQHQISLASNAGITVAEKSIDGHHSFLVWKEGYVTGLPWMMNRLGLTLSEK